jgi:hypothetical protein
MYVTRPLRYSRRKKALVGRRFQDEAQPMVTHGAKFRVRSASL